MKHSLRNEFYFFHGALLKRHAKLLARVIFWVRFFIIEKNERRGTVINITFRLLSFLFYDFSSAKSFQSPRRNQHGSLFQEHTKAKPIDDDAYLLTLVCYIHQNPVWAGLVDELAAWPYSSYPDLAGLRNGTLPDHSLVNSKFNFACFYFTEQRIIQIPF